MKRTLGGVLALLLVGCAAGHHELYSLDDFDLEWRDGQGLVVTNVRLQARTPGVHTGPLVFLAPSTAAEKAGCYEGLYNPKRLSLAFANSRGAVDGVLLCHDAGAKNGFRLELRSPKGELNLLTFTAGSAAAVASVDKNGSTLGRVRLPAQSVVFRDHPELLGAILALGVLPAKADGFYELK